MNGGPGSAGIIHRNLTGAILRAYFELRSELGCGFLEAVYANGLAILLRESGHHVAREVTYDVVFHGERIGRYRADLVVDGLVVVEAKAARRLDPAHAAQLWSCLRASRLEVGLLLNFGMRREFRRIVASRPGALPAG